MLERCFYIFSPGCLLRRQPEFPLQLPFSPLGVYIKTMLNRRSRFTQLEGRQVALIARKTLLPVETF